jgi:cytidine deaminase
VSELLDRARAAANRAYAPYSRLPVGAAVRGTSGKIYEGANIENRSLGLTVCAARTATFRAVLAGDCEIRELALYGPGQSCRPWGACLQVLAEFASAHAAVTYRHDGAVVTTRLSELLPLGQPSDRSG